MLGKIGKSRLKKLIAFMESLPKSADEHFNMSYWVQHKGNRIIATENPHGLADGSTKGKLLGCGTVACAAGWATAIPSFKKAGFVFKPSFGGTLKPAIPPGVFFEVGELGDMQLFGAHLQDRITTPKQWAKHAKQWLRAKEAVQKKAA